MEIFIMLVISIFIVVGYIAGSANGNASKELKNELQQQEEKYKALCGEWISLMEKCASLEERVENNEVATELENTRSAYNEVVAELENTRSAYNEVVAELNSFYKKYASLQKQCTFLEKGVEKLHFDLDAKISENAALNAQMQYLQPRLNKEQIEREIFEKAASIRQRPQYDSIPIFHAMADIFEKNHRILSAIQNNMTIRDFKASASITSEKQNTYRTTLTSCTCPDFKHRKQTCKHMYRLALELGLLISAPTDKMEATIIELQEKIEDYHSEKEQRQKDLQKYQEEKDNLKIELEELALIRNSEQQTFPWLAGLYADYFYLKDEKQADELRDKNRPALKASETVSQLAREKKEILKQSKMLEYQLNFYESLFPWLLDFKELDPKDVETISFDTHEEDEAHEYTHLKKYLSPLEYEKLTVAEKLQLALDRYKDRQKSNWDVGIEYERYIGYLYETKDYTVTYSGALLGLEDMGRDLIVKSKDTVLIIQCKRWAQEKVLHEKHIFQLYGSVVLYQIQHPKKKVSGVFYTTASLSDVARECADFLGIECHENFRYEEYPLVKCNFSNAGEKIYHLPFDQRYDRIFITPEKGDCYVKTIKEAEKLGFRHAYKWNPSKTT